MSREQLAFHFDEPASVPTPGGHGDEPAAARHPRTGAGAGHGTYTLTCADVLDWAQSYTGPKFHAMLLDGPYGLEFMGKAWDAPWKYSFTTHGYTDGAQRMPAPGLTSSRNPMCRHCHRHQRGWKDTPGCECSSPDFDTRDHEQRDMEKFQSWYTQVFKALAQHLLPGAFIMAFASSRGFHRVMTAMEDAGLRLYPAIFGWLSGQSFPKASRIDTKIDAHGGANIGWFGPWLRQWREEQGISQKDLAQHFPSRTGGLTGCVANWELGLNLPTVEQYNTLVRVLNLPFDNLEAADRAVIGQRITGIGTGNGSVPIMGDGTRDLTAPATPLAQTWAGHRYGGQMLKNSLEPIIVAQVPYAGKPVQSITSTGAGALNIDGGRISGIKERPHNQQGMGELQSTNGWGTRKILRPEGYEFEGRWPPNFAISHLPSCVQVGTRQVQGITGGTGNHNGQVYGTRTNKGQLVHDYADANGLLAVGAWACADGCPVAALDAQAGVRTSGGQATIGTTRSSDAIYGHFDKRSTTDHDDHHGPASRFFHVSDWCLDVAEQLAQADPVRYCPKASRGERDAGLDSDVQQRTSAYGAIKVRTCNQCGSRRNDGIPCSTSPSCGHEDWTWQKVTDEGSRGGAARNPHPTVKPLALCRWLATLLLPPAAYAPRRLLVPFAGTGSEAIGAILAGWDDVMLVEQDASYIALAEHRLAYWSRRMAGGV